MRSTGLVLACCLALIAGASSTTTAQTRSPAAQVTVSKPATSLPGSTYAWVPMPPTLPVESDPRVQDPALRARLQASLDKVLQDCQCTGRQANVLSPRESSPSARSRRNGPK